VPEFDFRDMLGGADGTLSDPLKSSAAIRVAEAGFVAMTFEAKHLGRTMAPSDSLGALVSMMSDIAKDHPTPGYWLGELARLREHLDRIETSLLTAE